MQMPRPYVIQSIEDRKLPEVKEHLTYKRKSELFKQQQQRNASIRHELFKEMEHQSRINHDSLPRKRGS